LAFGRLRLRGELFELRAEDLRFTEAEAAALLAANLDGELAPAEVAALVDRTEGWVAGLYMAALSLRGRSDRKAFLEQFAGSHRHIVEYLSREVLENLDEEVRRFLIRTSVLERFCAPLCDGVTGAEGAAAHLAVLERSNLFLVPLDDQGIWYRYHHMFADVLRGELARREPGMAGELHRRASAWHRGRGTVNEAIRHALVAEDW